MTEMPTDKSPMVCLPDVNVIFTIKNIYVTVSTRYKCKLTKCQKWYTGFWVILHLLHVFTLLPKFCISDEDWMNAVKSQMIVCVANVL